MLFQNWRKTIAFLVIIFLAIALFSWADLRFNRQPFLSFAQEGIRELLMPLQNRFERLFSRVQEWLNGIRELGTLRDSNIILRQENEELVEQALRLKEALDENERLRELLDYRHHSEAFSFITARIVAMSGSWSSRFILNVGANDNVKIDMPVVTPRGVIGRIVRVTANSAELMLLQDLLSGVGGRIQSSGALGIVRGQGSQQPQLLMTNISLDADVRPGDSVYTSGFGDTFPAGQLIGTIISVAVDETGLHQIAVLQMAEDNFRLREVLIIAAEFDLEELSEEVHADEEQQEPS